MPVVIHKSNFQIKSSNNQTSRQTLRQNGDENTYTRGSHEEKNK